MAKEDTFVDTIIERYDNDGGMLIPMMQDIQEECGYLPHDHLRLLSMKLGVPLAQVYGVATFYSSFSLTPGGLHQVTLCVGTVCHLKGAREISEAITGEFGMKPGGTSEDGFLTLHEVNCVGACALAPVMIVDGRYHGGMTPRAALKAIKALSLKENS